MNKKALLFATFLIFFCQVSCAAATYEARANSIRLMENGEKVKICSLNMNIDFAVESFDGNALIVSNRGFVKKSDLIRCLENEPVPISMIPEKVGILSDVNVSKAIYVSLEFVSAQPFTWLATVARLGSSKSLVTLNGAYLKGKPVSTLRKSSFGGSGEAGTSAISPDGQYVAVNGNINCRDDAYPGVWDLKNNIRVLMDDQSCSNLFLKHSK